MKKALFIMAIIAFGCSQIPVEKKQNCENPHVQLNPNNYNVGFLVLNGTYNTELTAPMDIFQHTVYRDSIKAMNVFTVSNTLDPITTFEGLKILPDYSYLEEVPHIDILVIPAAEHNLDSDLEDEQLISFVKETSKKASWVTSHCDGAFVLAKTGLLDDKTSTTFPGEIESYKTMFPHLQVEDSVLFVQDGKYITSAGGAKSFEASLYLCELLYGKEKADQLAKGMVIDWNLDDVNKLIVDNSPETKCKIIFGDSLKVEN